jgi:hypothetical protein
LKKRNVGSEEKSRKSGSLKVWMSLDGKRCNKDPSAGSGADFSYFFGFLCKKLGGASRRTLRRGKIWDFVPLFRSDNLILPISRPVLYYFAYFNFYILSRCEERSIYSLEILDNLDKIVNIQKKHSAELL